MRRHLAFAIVVLAALPAPGQQAFELWRRLGESPVAPIASLAPSPRYQLDSTGYFGPEDGGLCRISRTVAGGLVSLNITQLGAVSAGDTVTAIGMQADYEVGLGKSLYLGTQDGRLVRSDDYGATALVTYQLTDGAGNPVRVTGIVAWDVGVIHVVVTTDRGGVFRSTDGLATAPSSWSTSAEARALAVDLVGNDVYIAILTSSGDTEVEARNGGPTPDPSWTSKGTVAGAVPVDIEVVDMGGSRHLHLGTSNRGTKRSTNDGVAWVESCDGSSTDTSYRGSAVALCPAYSVDRHVQIARDDGSLTSYNYGGSTSAPCSRDFFRAPVTRTALVQNYHLAPPYPDLYSGTEAGLFVETSQRSDRGRQALSKNHIKAVAAAAAGGAGAWASASFGLARLVGGTEMLDPWAISTLPSGWSGAGTAVAWGNLASGWDVLLGTQEHGAAFSDDGGSTFTHPLTIRGSPRDVRSAAPFGSGALLLATADGAFATLNGGASFIALNQGAGSLCVGALYGVAVMRHANDQYVALAGSAASQGILRRSFSFDPATARFVFQGNEWETTGVTTGAVERFDTRGQGNTEPVWAASSTDGFYVNAEGTRSIWTKTNPSGVTSASSVRLGNDLTSVTPWTGGQPSGSALIGMGELHHYHAPVPEGSLTLSLTLRVLSGEASLFLRYGELAQGTGDDYSSTQAGDDAICARAVTGTWAAGDWYVGVRGEAAGTVYELFATIDGPCQDLGPVALLDDDFESDLGWTLAGNAEWERAQPQGLSGWLCPDPPSAYSGMVAIGNDLTVDGDYPPSASGTATSPSVNASGHTGMRLDYARSLVVDDPSLDQARTLLSTNDFGSSVELYQNPGVVCDFLWALERYDIEAWADGQPNVRVRFRLDSDGSEQRAGWTVDDVSLSGYSIVSSASLASGEWDYYRIASDGTEADIQIAVTPAGPTDDPDLHVVRNHLPTQTSWAWRPDLPAGVTESVCISPPWVGVYYIGVRGDGAATYGLTVKRNEGCTPSAVRRGRGRVSPPRTLGLSSRLFEPEWFRSAPDPRIVLANIAWGTVDGAGVYRNAINVWETRNGTGWGQLANLAARSVIQPTSGDVFCGSNGNLFVSEYPDEGLTAWIDIGAYVAGNPNWTITDFHENGNGDLMVSMDGPFAVGAGPSGGVWLTRNGGKAWIQLNKGFDVKTEDIKDLVSDDDVSGTVLYYASTDGSGLYDRTITPDPLPKLAALSAGSGGAAGGDTLMVSGTGFRNACVTGVTTDCPFGDSPVVWFGGTPAVATWLGPIDLQVVTPPHGPGTVPVTVMNPDTGESESLSYTFLNDGSSAPLLTILRSGNTVQLGWNPGGRVAVERSESLPFVPSRRVDAVGSAWMDPEPVITNGTTYYYRVLSQ